DGLRPRGDPVSTRPPRGRRVSRRSGLRRYPRPGEEPLRELLVGHERVHDTALQSVPRRAGALLDPLQHPLALDTASRAEGRHPVFEEVAAELAELLPLRLTHGGAGQVLRGGLVAPPRGHPRLAGDPPAGGAYEPP